MSNRIRSRRQGKSLRQLNYVQYMGKPKSQVKYLIYPKLIS